jgi:hypothetical protein
MDLTTIGNQRYISNLRQISGLLLIAGFCAIIFPLNNVIGSIGPSGTTANEGIPLSRFIAGLCTIKIGLLAIFIGYNITIHNWTSKLLVAYAIVWTQTAFIAYFTDMTMIGRAAKNMTLISSIYNPTQTDQNVVGAMGILAVITYGFTFIGSISFFLFSIYAFINGKPQDRNSSYYRGRFAFYGCMLFIAGLSQLIIGSYIQSKFANVYNLKTGPIGVAVYVVSIPSLNIIVGLFQMFNATWGLSRALFHIGYFGSNHETDMSYQISVYIGWFIQFLFQVIVSPGIVPGMMLADAPAAIASISFGLNIMPAFLDYQARTTPEHFEDEYYGITTTSTSTTASTMKDIENGNMSEKSITKIMENNSELSA